MKNDSGLGNKRMHKYRKIRDGLLDEFKKEECGNLVWLFMRQKWIKWDIAEDKSI